MQQNVMGKQFPQSISLLESLLLEEKKRCIPPIIQKTQLHQFCCLCGLVEEEQIAQASQLLNNFGVIIYFPTDPKLSDMVFLDPNWLSQLIASLITTKHR